MKQSCCLYPGSFDPVTNGHMDLIRRAAALFDRVVVGVLHNPDKQGCFSVEQRLDMLKRACRDVPGVEIVAHGGLLAELTRELGVTVVVRGVRGSADLENETVMARINGQLHPGLETVFLPASAACQDISASMVRQLALFGADLSAYVPREVIRDIEEKFARNQSIGEDS